VKLFEPPLRIYKRKGKKGGTRLNELRLIKRIKRHVDRVAADELIRSYYDEIHGFLRKQVSDPENAKDLTQEVFISMLKTIAGFDPKRGAGFRTWLYRIATNKVVDYFRSRSYKNGNRTLSFDEFEPVSEEDFTEQLADTHFSQNVCDYVGGFEADTQQIFRLHIFGGYTFAEISAMLEMPESSVKSKYYRLIKLLRKEFADYE
jgi:RNA polymerase sigma-70 factor (ECF subfamily)